MTKVIYKYEISITKNIALELPVGSEILTVITKHNFPYVYAIVDKSQKNYETRKFKLFGTGEDFDLDSYKYIGTITKESGMTFIFHLFEVV